MVTSARILNLAQRAEDPIGAGSSVFRTLWHGRISGLSELLSDADIVHFHGVYHISYLSIARICRHRQIPYVISPRSGLMRSAMAKSRLKKQVCNFLAFDHFVANANARHFLSEDEAAHSRFSDLSYFVAPNGISIPERIAPVECEPFVLSYIGRFDVRQKGLDILLSGVHKAQRLLRRVGAIVRLYGPDHRGGQRVLMRRVQRLGLANVVTLNGPVQGAAKTDTLCGSSVFVHTSRYEGQPQAVLEAWAAGRAALVTPGTNLMSDVQKHRIGWVAPATPAGIASTIERVVADPMEVVNRGQFARHFAQDQLTLEKAAHGVLNGYLDVMHHGSARAA